MWGWCTGPCKTLRLSGSNVPSRIAAGKWRPVGPPREKGQGHSPSAALLLLPGPLARGHGFLKAFGKRLATICPEIDLLNHMQTIASEC